MPQKTYLGDSVYADHDGEFIVLTVENGLGPTETIYLDDEVYGQLVKFANAIRVPASQPAATSGGTRPWDSDDRPQIDNKPGH